MRAYGAGTKRQTFITSGQSALPGGALTELLRQLRRTAPDWSARPRTWRRRSLAYAKLSRAADVSIAPIRVSAGNVKKADLLRMRLVEHTDCLGGGLQ